MVDAHAPELGARARARVPRRSVRVLLAACVLCVLAWQLTAEHVIERAAEGRMFERLEQVPARSVAIVLGARVFAGGRLSHTVEDRVACGLELYRGGKVGRVLLTGDHGQHSYDEVNAMAAALAAGGVPDQVVFLDHAGFRTLDSMHRARAVFAVSDAVICTQRFHLARALYLAHHFGIDAVGLVSDRRRYAKAAHNALRERGARAAALFDVLIGRGAKWLGPVHAISGDGRATRDRRAPETP